MFSLVLSFFLTKPDPLPDSLNLIVTRAAFVYNVPQETLARVIFCESSNNPNAVGDNGHAKGLVQIHEIYHPEVTDAQAFDSDFSVRFLAKAIHEGHGNEWTCWRKLNS